MTAQAVNQSQWLYAGDPRSPSIHQKRIARYRKIAMLRAFWKRLERGSLPASWQPGPAFEHLVLQAFKLAGARVTWPYEVRLSTRPGEPTLEQVDGLVWLDSMCFMVEAKNQQENIDFEPIAKLRARLARRPSSIIGVVFSRTGFTDPAKLLARFASPQTVLLWEGAELTFALGRRAGVLHGLQSKYEMALKYALPDYNIVSEAIGS